MNDIHCCKRFAAKLGDAGTRGFAFLVGEINAHPVILVQSRGVSFEDEQALPKIGIAINISTEMPVRYCPFCGADFNLLLKSYSDEYKKKANIHAPFIGQFKSAQQ